METTLPEPLLASTLHGVENVNPSNPNPNKPVASINDTMYQQVSTLRGANDTVVKKHTETITVAENFTLVRWILVLVLEPLPRLVRLVRPSLPPVPTWSC